jgi:hypothetical protein
MKRCFTLIETLIVFCVIAMIISIMLPSLLNARATAIFAKIHITSAGIVTATQMYTSDFKGIFPYMGVPGRPWEGVWIDDRRPEVSYLLSNPASYFSQSLLYVNLLHNGYFGDKRVLLFPGVEELAANDLDFITPYQMTTGAFAAPTYWIGEEPPLTLGHFRGVGLHEALFPSAKGLILHTLSGVFDPNDRLKTNTFSVALVDGSAGSKVSDSFMWERVPNRPYGGSPFPIIKTPHGIAGRDFGVTKESE